MDRRKCAVMQLLCLNVNLMAALMAARSGATPPPDGDGDGEQCPGVTAPEREMKDRSGATN
jgi:hypothetical protein